ncbi:hypothetical protein HOD20_08245 [archaeon]|jgi:hypothetical protein|nr:hypothetical protein [archaeon]MBT4647199.1 hypothetical protein [archaeon]MBT6822202.1 hypothetical protein [archaeon]MBT7391723.1 hypothetical protein [archaeon]
MSLDETHQVVQSSNLPEDLKEIVGRIARDAEDMDLRLSEFKILHKTKMVGVAVGGSVFVLGILFVLVSIFIFFNLFSLNYSEKIRLAVSSVATVIGIVQLLAGILLIGR